MKTKLPVLNDLISNYENHPVICSYCGKAISSKKYTKQINEEYKFCSKNCSKKFYDETKKDRSIKPFCSETEKTIYTFLTLNYSNFTIFHNDKNLIKPYELDFIINKNDNNTPIIIEYNSAFHLSKVTNNERKLIKNKINDKEKKKIICNELKYRMIRIWSEIGLYSHFETFNKVLNILKSNIDSISSSSVCIDIIIDKDEEIHVNREYF